MSRVGTGREGEASRSRATAVPRPAEAGAAKWARATTAPRVTIRRGPLSDDAEFGAPLGTYDAEGTQATEVEGRADEVPLPAHLRHAP